VTINSELVDRIALRLGSRTNPNLRPGIVSEVNAAIALLERASFLPWFLEDPSAVLANTVQSVSTVALPNQFLRQIDVTKPFYYVDNVSQIMNKREAHYINQRNTSLKEGPPTAYHVQKTTVLIGPIPDKVYTITFPSYVASNSVFADNGTVVANEWLIYASDWIMNLAGSIVAGLHLHNRNMAKELQAYAGAAKGEIYKDHVAREMANFDDDVDKFVGER